MAALNSPLICLVDDSEDYRLMVAQLLRRYCVPHSLVTFADGAGLLDALTHFEHLPDLILLDQHMPGLNGHKTLLRLKTQTRYRKIPIVMMSAQASTDEIDGCYEAWANSFLRKQVDANRLIDDLRNLCQYWLSTNQRPST